MQNQRGLIYAIFTSGALLGACGATLAPGAMNVRVMKNDPPHACQELGTVRGTRALCINTDDNCPKTRMRNEAAELGANYLRLETVGPGGMTGTAFLCPDHRAAQR